MSKSRGQIWLEECMSTVSPEDLAEMEEHKREYDRVRHEVPDLTTEDVVWS